MEILINKGQNPSYATDLNFLAKKGKIYVMDNHLAAFWCWVQELDPEKEIYNLLHIDRHHDFSDSLIKKGFHKYKSQDFKKLTLDEMLVFTIEDEEESFQLIRWDNYIKLFMVLYPGSINHIKFVTPQRLDREISNSAYESNRESIEGWLQNDKLHKPAYYETMDNPRIHILNLDIDAFFVQVGDKLKEIKDLDFVSLKSILDKKVIEADIITIALSPECCRGWDNALKMFYKIDSLLGLGFGKLPI